jgi:hypothetical protein
MVYTVAKNVVIDLLTNTAVVGSFVDLSSYLDLMYPDIFSREN